MKGILDKIIDKRLLYRIYIRIKHTIIFEIVVGYFSYYVIHLIFKNNNFDEKTDKIIIIALFIIWFTFYLVYNHTNLFIKNYDTSKIGVLFCCKTSTMSEYSDMKTSLFSHLKDTFRKNNINLIECDPYFSKRIEKIHNIGKKLNISMIINVKEIYGNENSVKKYSFTIENVEVVVKHKYVVLLNKLKEDFNNIFNRTISIYENNDINIAYIADCFNICCRYLISSICLINENPQSAIVLAKGLQVDILSFGKRDSNIEYAYQKTDNILLVANDMIITEKMRQYQPGMNGLLKEVEQLIKEQQLLLNRVETSRYNKNINYSTCKYNIYVALTYIWFEYGNIKESINNVNKSLQCNNYDQTTALFDKAFLLAVNKDYNASCSIYKKLFRKKVNGEIVNSVIDYFSVRISKNIFVETCLFCDCIVNYYYNNKEVAQKEYLELKNIKSQSIDVLQQRVFNR